MKLNHIGLEVADSYKMELFYRKYFGFKTLYRYASINQKGLHTVILADRNLTLELLERPQNNTGIPAAKNTFHISLHTNDVIKEYTRLKNLGLDSIKAPRVTGDGFLESEASDPEGNIIEISKRVGPFPSYKIKAVIFDLDGTVIDSENNYFEGDRILMKSYGINLTREMKYKYIGMSSLDMMKDLQKIYNIKDSPETMLARKENNYLELARKNTKVYPEMIKFIEMLKKADFSLAIASSSSKENVNEIIKIIALNNYFSVILSAESVENNKPAPDVFLEAARQLKIEPVNCAVVEDSQFGVEAAKRAFMTCIAVPCSVPGQLSERFLTADLIFKKGIKGFRAGKAFKWIRSKV